MAAGYHVLPEIYDRWQKTYGNDYSTLILPKLLGTIVRFDIPVSTMLDVACGTGSLALMMARRGWKVWGVDASEEMLVRARRKFRGKRLPATLLHQDMCEIRLPTPVDLATSMFDSINHATSQRELLKTFRGVHRSLLPGGYFVFDTNNELCFRSLWTRTDAIHHRDFTIIMQNRYIPGRKKAYSFVTVFLRRGEGYARQVEIVQERFFSREEVATLLRKAGFRVLEIEDFNFTDMPEIGKIKTWWVARRES